MKLIFKALKIQELYHPTIGIEVCQKEVMYKITMVHDAVLIEFTHG